MLELAWMQLDDPDWKVGNIYESYIQYAGPINPLAQASNHIRADQLTEARGAIPREKAVVQLLTSMETTSFAVAHNSAFDSKFLPEVAVPWICTYRVSKRIWPEAPGHGNQVLRYWLNIKPDMSMAPNIRQRAPHQALYDVATTVGILRRMLEVHTPQELYHMTHTPMLLKTMPFGKHKGKAFDQIPRDYLQWMQGQFNLDPDVKHTIDAVLR